jgi:hypothetical protein
VVSDVRVRAAQAKQRLESDRGVVERLGRSMEELEARGERLKHEVAELADKEREVLERTESDRALLGDQSGEAICPKANVKIVSRALNKLIKPMIRLYSYRLLILL